MYFFHYHSIKDLYRGRFDEFRWRRQLFLLTLTTQVNYYICMLLSWKPWSHKVKVKPMHILENHDKPHYECEIKRQFKYLLKKHIGEKIVYRKCFKICIPWWPFWQHFQWFFYHFRGSKAAYQFLLWPFHYSIPDNCLSFFFEILKLSLYFVFTICMENSICVLAYLYLHSRGKNTHLM